MKTKILYGMLAFALMVPTASAVTQSADTDQDGNADIYVHVDEGADGSSGVYEETNGCDGLQESSGDCDGDGDVEKADSSVLPGAPSP